jgi:hypothetical protein
VGKDLQQTWVIDAMLLAKVVLVKFQSASIHPSGILTLGIVTCPIDSTEKTSESSQLLTWQKAMALFQPGVLCNKGFILEL